jgi:transcription termination factor Rho
LSPRKKKIEEDPKEEVIKEEKKPARKSTTRKRQTPVKAKEKKETSAEEVQEAKTSAKTPEIETKQNSQIAAKEEQTVRSSSESETTIDSPGPEVPDELKDAIIKKDKDNIREVEIDISQLQTMPIREIYKLARKYDIPGYTQMAKKDLIFMVLKGQTESYGYFFDQGVLEITDGGYGFLRTMDNNLLPSSNDIYVSQSQIRRFNLTSGDTVAGQVRPPKEGEKYFALLRIEAINHKAINFAAERITFQNLTPIYPEDQIITETDSHVMSTRILDLFSPIGKGQRGLIVSPPKAGKTTLLKELANGIAENHPDTVRIILLIDERPEEVTDLRRSTNAHVLAAPFDMHPEKQIRVAEMTLEMAKRLVEFNYDVVILLDSITRLARAYNLYVPPSGKLLSGGVDPSALYKPKHFFGAARNIEEGGSLTIIATALIETGSKMDEVIFEEFKGTGNMELVLSRQISNKRMFPAINLVLSGTRKEELLLPHDVLRKVWVLRRMLSAMSEEEGLRLIMEKLRGTPDNEEFLDLIEMEKKY